MANQISNSGKIKKTIVYFFIVVIIMALFYMAYGKLLDQLSGGDVDLSSFNPVYSDEVEYYYAIALIYDYGIVNDASPFGFYNDGFYLPPHLSFGAHGFVPILPHVAVLKLLGWDSSDHMPVALLHVIFLGVAFLIFALLVSDAKKLIICMIITLLYFPLVIYFGVIMIELGLFAMSVLYAGTFYHYLRNRGRLAIIILIAVGIIGVFFRITNIIFFIPFLVCEFRHVKRPVFIGYIGGLVLLGLAVQLFHDNFSAPYPAGWMNSFISIFENYGFTAALSEFVSHTIYNTKNFLIPLHQPALFYLMRFSILILFVLYLIKAFFIFDAGPGRLKKRSSIDLFSLSVSLMILFIVGSLIALYDVFDWRDFRVLAPFLLFIILTAILRYEKSIVPAVAGVMIVLLFISQFGLIKDQIPERWGPRSVSPASKLLEFTENADSKWENMAISYLGFPPDIDPRIGLVYSFTPLSGISDLKCKYVLSGEELSAEGYEEIFRDNDSEFFIYQWE